MDYIDQTQSPMKTSKVFILPRTKRYEELEAKRLEEENMKKAEAEEVLKTKILLYPLCLVRKKTYGI